LTNIKLDGHCSAKTCAGYDALDFFISSRAPPHNLVLVDLIFEIFYSSHCLLDLHLESILKMSFTFAALCLLQALVVRADDSPTVVTQYVAKAAAAAPTGCGMFVFLKLDRFVLLRSKHRLTFCY
jgi:hypothetical protein